MARGVRFLLGFRPYPFLKKNGPGIPVFGYCPFFYVTHTENCRLAYLYRSTMAAQLNPAFKFPFFGGLAVDTNEPLQTVTGWLPLVVQHRLLPLWAHIC